jgi:hypothetical protein
MGSLCWARRIQEYKEMSYIHIIEKYTTSKEITGIWFPKTPEKTTSQTTLLSRNVRSITEYIECQAFWPVVRIGSPTPSPASECCSKGETHPLAGGWGGGWGSQFRRRDRHSATLYVYYTVVRVLGLFSSRPNWDSFAPSTTCEFDPTSFGSGGGGGVPILTIGQTLWYSRYTCTCTCIVYFPSFLAISVCGA